MSVSKKKILITGGAGFVGYHLARHLLDSYGDVVLVLVDDLSRGQMDNDFKNLLDDPRVKFIQLDLTDPYATKKLGSGYDHVYHLAAVQGTKNFYKIPHEVMRINTLSLIYMLEWMQKENAAGKILFTSSNEAYAGSLESNDKFPFPTPENVPLTVSDPYNPRWSYGVTKLVGEPFMIHYAVQHGFRGVIVRPHNFYGPRAGYDHVIPEFSLRIAAQVDPFPIFGADDTRTFCYIDDAVRAMRMLMDSPQTDNHPIETVHIGDRDEIKIGDLADLMFQAAGWHPQRVDIKASPPGSVARRRADISKLEQLVGWQPKISLKDGLKRTYEWYKTHPKLI